MHRRWWILATPYQLPLCSPALATLTDVSVEIVELEWPQLTAIRGFLPFCRHFFACHQALDAHKAHPYKGPFWAVAQAPSVLSLRHAPPALGGSGAWADS